MRAKKYLFIVLCLTLLCIGTVEEIATATELQTHTNSIGMEFVLIPAGTFEWEAAVEESIKVYTHGPVGLTPPRDITVSFEPTGIIPTRKVTISKSFYLGKHEVTQEEWEAVMGKGSNPSNVKGPNNPVEQVSWDDAQEFIRRLNKKEGHNCYRLPTEAEWELAARGGTDTRWFFGDSEDSLEQYAWFNRNSGGKTHPVAQKKPNQYGLYDIYGNVLEWVEDWRHEYPKMDVTDPKGPTEGATRVCRGGSGLVTVGFCSSDSRLFNPPGRRYGFLGFRLALSPE